MNEVIYLEPDVEITSVIDKIKSTKSKGVVLALPRGSTLAHSVVNLKLLRRTAESMGRFIIIAANDKIAKNLTSQIGLPYFSRVADAQNAKYKVEEPVVRRPAATVEIDETEEVDPSFKSAIKVKTYSRFDEERPEEEDDANLDDIRTGNESEDEEETYSRDIDETQEDEEEYSFRRSKISFADEEKEQKRQIDAEIDQALEREEEDEEQDEILISAADQRKEEAQSKKYEEKGKSAKVIKLSVKDHDTHHRRKVGIAIFVLLFVFVFIAGIAGAYAFFNKATISLTLKTEDFQSDYKLSVDHNIKEVDAARPAIPGQLLTKETEITKKITATGTKDAGEKAAGTVTIYNYTSQQLGLPAGKEIKTSGGLSFKLNAAVTVPASAGMATETKDCRAIGTYYDCRLPGIAADQKVTAVATGEKYNVAAGTFSFSSFSATDVFAESKAATTGGSTKQITIVTQDDIDNAEKTTKVEAMAKSKDELIASLTEGKVKYFDETLTQEVVTITASKKVGEEAAEFDYTMKVRSYATGFVEDDLKIFVLEEAKKAVPAGKMLVNPDGATLTYEIDTKNTKGDDLWINAKFVGKIGEDLNSASIARELKLKSLTQARSIIQTNSSIENFSIVSWPTFAPTMPIQEKKIKVNFDFVK